MSSGHKNPDRPQYPDDSGSTNLFEFVKKQYDESSVGDNCLAKFDNCHGCLPYTYVPAAVEHNWHNGIWQLFWKQIAGAASLF